MTHRNSDIENIVLDIERAELIANDAEIDRDVREDALVQFIKRAAPSLLDLLDELKQLRLHGGAAGDVRHEGGRIILEGFSDVSAEAALSSALDKAAHYFSEDHDVSITVQQMIELPNGGHRATLEVRITPFSVRDGAHIKGADIELKRDHDKAFQHLRHGEDDHAHHLIFEHFLAISNAKVMGKIPASLLINVNDAKLMHYMLEKQFLKAERAWQNVERTKAATLDEQEPQQILVHFKRD